MTLVAVRLGPVPSDSVLAWSASARRTIDTVQANPAFDVPEPVLERFQALVATWEAVATGTETFEWEAELDRAEVRHLAAHWLRLANLAREPGSGISPAPPEGQAFYDALAVAMLEAAGDDDDPDQLTSKLDELLPSFDARAPLSGLTATQPDQPVRSVLLVDDTADIRLLFRLALDLDPRFEIFAEAANGKEALAACAAGCPDLVLLDVMMPVMGGLETLPRLKELCPEVTVVMLSADDRPETRDEALRLGAKAFLAKTTSIEEVRTLLAAA